ncbi:phosphopantetheine-binding protein [Streptomyces klenkii]|uniref:phosphopantetheine-binding protein n=1 Tax=Streptomyces klenkii TaxID=1420899 RepID=UPI0033ACEF24
MDSERSELLAVVSHAYARVCHAEMLLLEERTELRDLALDSVQLLEIVVIIEQTLGVWAPDEALGGVVTVGDLCALLAETPSVPGVTDFEGGLS